MSEPCYEDMPALFAAALPSAAAQLIIDQDTGAVMSRYTWTAMIPPSTPITDAQKECTADERKAIAARVPPYDGVRTWGDLEAVRAKQDTKPAKERSG